MQKEIPLFKIMLAIFALAVALAAFATPVVFAGHHTPPAADSPANAPAH